VQVRQQDYLLGTIGLFVADDVSKSVAKHRIQRGVGFHPLAFLEIKDVEVVVKKLVFLVLNAFVVE
jgi:hypothetical protein